MVHLQKIMNNRLILKINAFIIALGIWHVTHQSEMTLNHAIPLCFYNQSPHYHIESPECVQITLRGKKKDLDPLHLSELAFHYDCNKLALGAQTLELSKMNLFLPETIKLLHYKPSQVVVMVKKV